MLYGVIIAGYDNSVIYDNSDVIRIMLFFAKGCTYVSFVSSTLISYRQIYLVCVTVY